jgi:T-complex protein 1 subunit theta
MTNELIEGDIKRMEKAKVAIFTCALDVAQTETKGTVLLKTAGELMNFSKVLLPR